MGRNYFQSIWKITERDEFIIHVKITQTMPRKSPIIWLIPALPSLPVRGATKKSFEMKKKVKKLLVSVSVHGY